MLRLEPTPPPRQPNVTGLEGMTRVAHLNSERYVVVAVGNGWDVYTVTDEETR